MTLEETSGRQSGQPALSRRRWVRLAIRLGGSAVILTALVALVSPGQLMRAVSRLNPELLVPAIVVYLGLHLLGTSKWRIMTNAAGAGLSMTHAARCYYLGLFSNTFLISLVGGDVVRAGAAMRYARSKAGLLVGSLVDRLFDVAGLLAITIGAALWMPRFGDDQGRVLYRGLLLGAGMLAVVVAGLFVLVSMRRLPFKLRRHLVRLRAATHAVVRQPHLVLLAVGIGIVLQASLVVMNAWLGAACGLHLPLWAWLFAWPLAKIVSMAPVSLGGLGVREAALVSLLVPFGADAASVVAAGLAFEAVIIGGGLASGLIALLLATGFIHRFNWPGMVDAGRLEKPSTASETSG
jgi:glycosyltransferase 2 family protein